MNLCLIIVPSFYPHRQLLFCFIFSPPCVFFTFANNGSSFTGNVVINGGTVATTKSRTGTTSALGATTTPGGRTITVNAGAELALGASDTFGGCDSSNVYDDNSVRLIVNGGKISGTNNNSLYNATFQNGAELYGLCPHWGRPPPVPKWSRAIRQQQSGHVVIVLAQGNDERFLCRRWFHPGKPR